MCQPRHNGTYPPFHCPPFRPTLLLQSRGPKAEGSKCVVSIREHNWFRLAAAGLFGLLLVAAGIAWFTTQSQNPNSLLTGRWLMSLSGVPRQYVVFSPSGDVTCYKLDGTTINMVPGYGERWIVRGNVIECISKEPAKPLRTRVESFLSRVGSSHHEPPIEPALYAYTIEDDSTLQLDLLDPRLQHRVILRRVPPGE
jgi:hypothetical protein